MNFDQIIGDVFLFLAVFLMNLFNLFELLFQYFIKAVCIWGDCLKKNLLLGHFYEQWIEKQKKKIL